jgi:hypothetical protein
MPLSAIEIILTGRSSNPDDPQFYTQRQNLCPSVYNPKDLAELRNRFRLAWDQVRAGVLLRTEAA